MHINKFNLVIGFLIFIVGFILLSYFIWLQSRGDVAGTFTAFSSFGLALILMGVIVILIAKVGK